MAQGIFNLKQVNQAIRQDAWAGIYAPKFVEYLVVAGGGGGQTGGGGGAGGLLTGIVPVTAGASYTVTVGGGGSNGGGGASVQGVNGTNSVFGSIVASGGGGGGSYNGTTTGKAGGSGGGAYNVSDGGQGTANQGNAGASGNSITNSTGGGGGAGNMGLNPLDANGPIGTAVSGGGGGQGVASAISGAIMTYAGGGGGGVGTGATLRSNGGIGGGGLGCIAGDALNTTGNVNTGGGGGGGFYVNSDGKAGGSGIVIVRYPGSVQFYTGGTVGYANGYIVHTFYSNGTLAPTTPTQYSNTYQISRSLRFNAADSAHLIRTPSSVGNRKTWTWSGWVKFNSTPDGFNEWQVLFAAGIYDTATPSVVIEQVGPNLRTAFFASSAYVGYNFTTEIARDYSGWYHIVVAVDTTQAIATDRNKIYINGVLTAQTGAYSALALNYDTGVNLNQQHSIGGVQYYSAQPYQGFAKNYMTEINFIDGQALTPSSFGEYDVNTGVWKPRAYGGSYGTNGFYLNFSDNTNTTAATLGKDYSGNSNNFTPYNFSVTAGVTNDSFVDTPTQYGTDTGVGGEVRGNYCTLNYLDVAGTPTLSEGNLKIVNTNADGVVRGTFGMPGNSGKWYFEITQQTAVGTAGQSPIVYGMATLQSKVSHSAADILKAAYYYTDYLSRYLLVYVNGAQTLIPVATAIAINEVLQFAYDSDTGKVWIGKSNVWSDSSGGTTGNPATGANPTYTFASVAEPMTPTFDHAGVNFTATLNCGQRPFVTTAPTGFKALCTTNLPTPTIGATAATQANKFFNPVTYTGTGASRQVSVGFQPDWVWVKTRSQVSRNTIFDAVREVTKVLWSDSTDAEGTANAGTGLTSLNSNGFTLGTEIAGTSGSTNVSAVTYVAWNWKASNATAVTNTSGSITSQVSANPTAGFSIVTYTASGVTAARTVGHGLDVAPSFMMIRSRSDSDNWYAYHTSIGNTKAVFPNLTNATFTNVGYWANTSPTSSVFTVGTIPTTYNTYIAYCFAEIAGYSKFGSYTGNGSADGPFVHTGFKPAFVMIKRTDSTGNWWIYDTARTPKQTNAADEVLYANITDAETASSSDIDLLSNGFKLRVATYQPNTSSGTFIYMAFASQSFKYSLASS